jgi:hypothetical protein
LIYCLRWAGRGREKNPVKSKESKCNEATDRKSATRAATALSAGRGVSGFFLALCRQGGDHVWNSFHTACRPTACREGSPRTSTVFRTRADLPANRRGAWREGWRGAFRGISMISCTKTDLPAKIARGWSRVVCAPEAPVGQRARTAVNRHPSFAPLYLILGDLHRDRGESDPAIACYRKGLDLVAEPDLESRLLCATAGLVPRDSIERAELARRAVSLRGSLVAHATAALMGVR